MGQISHRPNRRLDIGLDNPTSTGHSLTGQRVDFQFDVKLLEKAPKFLSSIKQSFLETFADELLKAIGQGSSDPAAVNFSPSNRQTLVTYKLLPRILSTHHLRDLSVIEEKDCLNDIIDVFDGQRFETWKGSEAERIQNQEQFGNELSSATVKPS
ncbi:hypothetical protein BLNAU_10154 [Blattamonas nauphoetae]|uniref:Uncharacterized protein n=1 Tax=Blattamonas nauphoetae TaxID=2049346 RepID=A0ABQ9XTL4_9EUKA|nr:hypothetical protein BLNAU_10154 [Blattamonas nauphoetae]